MANGSSATATIRLQVVSSLRDFTTSIYILLENLSNSGKTDCFEKSIRSMNVSLIQLDDTTSSISEKTFSMCADTIAMESKVFELLSCNFFHVYFRFLETRKLSPQLGEARKIR